jgi:AraC-like DNA-binding protein
MSFDLSVLSPFLRLAHDFRTPVAFRLPWRRINDHALLFFRSGSGRFTVNGTVYPIQSGTLFVLRPDSDLHCFSPQPGTAFHMYNLHFDLIERPDSRTIGYDQPPAGPRRRLPAGEVLPRDPASPCHLPVRLTPALQAYERLFLRALHAFSLPDPASVLRRKAALLDILAFLIHGDSKPKVDDDDDGLDRVIAHIHADLARPLPLSDLAQVAALSRSSFAAAFQRRFGLTPMAYVRRVRVETARHELLNLGLPVKAVAQRNGFANVHHFTRVFTRLTGFTPAHHRSVEPPAHPPQKRTRKRSRARS